MKGFIQRHVWLSAVVGFVLALAMGGSAVMAATGFTSTHMTTTTGTMNIITPPPTADFSYTLSASVVNFGTISINAGAQFSITSDPITITKTGNQNINGLSLGITGSPTGGSAGVSGIGSIGYRLNPTINPDGSGGTFTITISGSTYPMPAIVDFSSIVFTLTPN